MTIKEFAKEQSISTQAVYQKLKAANILLSSIKQGKTQELTEDGIKQLEKLFTKKQTEDFQSIEQLKVENQFLKERIKELTADRDRWAEEAKTAQDALKNEQQATHQAQALQMATLQSMKRRSLWARLTGKTEDKKNG